MSSINCFANIGSFSDYVAHQHLALIDWVDWKIGYHYTKEYNISGLCVVSTLLEQLTLCWYNTLDYNIQ